MRFPCILAAGLLILGAGPAARAEEPPRLDPSELPARIQPLDVHYGAYLNGFSMGVIEIELDKGSKKSREFTSRTEMSVGPVTGSEVQTVVFDKHWQLVHLREERSGAEGTTIVEVVPDGSGQLVVSMKQGAEREESAVEDTGLIPVSAYRTLLAQAEVPLGAERRISFFVPMGAAVDEAVARWVGPEEVEVRGQRLPATRIEVSKQGVVSEVLWVADGHPVLVENQSTGLVLMEGTVEEAREDLPLTRDPDVVAVREALTRVLMALTAGDAEQLDAVADYPTMLAHLQEEGGEAVPASVDALRAEIHGGMRPRPGGISEADAGAMTRLFSVEVDGEHAKVRSPTGGPLASMDFVLVDGAWRLGTVPGR